MLTDMSRVPNASMYTERIKLRPKLYNPNSVARLSCMTMMDTQERIHEAHMRGYTMRGTQERIHEVHIQERIQRCTGEDTQRYI